MAVFLASPTFLTSFFLLIFPVWTGFLSAFFFPATIFVSWFNFGAMSCRCVIFEAVGTTCWVTVRFCSFGAVGNCRIAFSGFAGLLVVSADNPGKKISGFHS